MKLIKEIKSNSGELHFQRYSILSLPFFSIYLHKIYKSDEDKHLHNHPWNIFTIILQGSYEEKLLGGSKLVYKLTTREPGNFAWRSRNRYHKINQIFSPEVTTLALVFGKKSSWGYWVNNQHIEQEEYRKMKRNGNF